MKQAAILCLAAWSVSAGWAQPPFPPPPDAPQLWEPAQPRSWIGVGVIEVNEQVARRLGLPGPQGVEIASVADGSPAAQAGLAKGEVIVEFRGERVLGVEHFARLVRETPAGRQAEAAVHGASGRRIAAIEVGQRAGTFFGDGPGGGVGRGPFANAMREARVLVREMDFPKPRMAVHNRWLGAEMEELDGQFAEYFGVERGVLIRSVEKGSPAGRAGIKAGDVIVAVEGETVNKPADIRRLLSKPDGGSAAVDVMRNRQRRTFAVPLEHDGARMEPPRARPVSGRIAL